MKHKYKILVVDDDLNNIQVGINFLKQNEEYHLIFATSGQQALERVEETEFDLVLLDILMPVMDGYEVCRRLKKNSKYKNIPVIFLTAKQDAESLMKGFELGGADYITKPFNAPELHARVRTHLELRRYYQTEIAKLKEALSWAQAAETLKFVSGSVGHECNNFLAVIPPSLQLLKNRLEQDNVDTSPYQSLFEGISNASSSIGQLLMQLTKVSILEDNSREVVDLNDVVCEIRQIFRGGLKYRIALDVETLGQPALVSANKLRIEQVLLNLLMNAQHAIRACGDDAEEMGRVRLSMQIASGLSIEGFDKEGEYLCVSVIDNGVGMTEEVKEQIFTRYFTTRKEAGGTGLGLAVSKSIIDSYGGGIEVESAPQKGARFDVYLPFYRTS